jgi:hypothetical protein
MGNKSSKSISNVDDCVQVVRVPLARNRKTQLVFSRGDPTCFPADTLLCISSIDKASQLHQHLNHLAAESKSSIDLLLDEEGDVKEHSFNVYESGVSRYPEPPDEPRRVEVPLMKQSIMQQIKSQEKGSWKQVLHLVPSIPKCAAKTILFSFCTVPRKENDSLGILFQQVYQECIRRGFNSLVLSQFSILKNVKFLDKEIVQAMLTELNSLPDSLETVYIVCEGDSEFKDWIAAAQKFSKSTGLLEPHPNVSRFKANLEVPFKPNLESLKNSGVRKDVFVKKSVHSFVVESLFSNEECLELIRMSEELGFASVSWEYSPEYRDCDRVVIISKSLSNVLWERLKLFLTLSDVEGVHPFGFESSGTWVPEGINECIRFTRYSDGHLFKPHRDGSFIRTNEDRSIYTVMVYLNQPPEFNGGETVLRVSENESKGKQTISPNVGTCVVFNHDIVHEGKSVSAGRKYILRTDLMFHRIEKSVSPKLDKNSNSLLQRAFELYDESIRLQKEGDVVGSTQKYLEATEIQVRHSKSKFHSAEYNALFPAGYLDSWTRVTYFLSVIELGKLSSVSRAFRDIVNQSPAWSDIYKRLWPTNDGIWKLVQNHSYHNWKLIVARKHDFEQNFQTLIVDVGRSRTKFCMIGEFVSSQIENRGEWCQFNVELHENPVSENAVVEDCGSIPSVIARSSGHYWSAFSGFDHYFVGEEIFSGNTWFGTEQLKFPWDALNRCNEHVIGVILEYLLLFAFGRPCKTGAHPLLFTVPPYASDQEMDSLTNLCFSYLKIPAVCMIPSSVLASCHYGLASSIVVQFGRQEIYVSLVVNFERIQELSQHIPYTTVGEATSTFSDDELATTIVQISQRSKTLQAMEIIPVILSGGLIQDYNPRKLQELLGFSFKIKDFVGKGPQFDVCGGGRLVSSLPNAKKFFCMNPNPFALTNSRRVLTLNIGTIDKDSIYWVSGVVEKCSKLFKSLMMSDSNSS